jgi:uncharacterized glyoxalase superfamily protein PhnB
MYDPARGYPKVVPYVLYPDVAAAARWLADVFGLREVVRFEMPDGTVGHSELEFGDYIVMLGGRGGRFGETASITLIFVDDVDGTCERATAAGGSVLDGPVDQPWGLRQAVIRDPQGQRWEVTQHVRDVAPEDWGARKLGPMPG